MSDPWLLICLLCLHHSCAAGSSITDCTRNVRTASSHDHWEHIVKRSAYSARYSPKSSRDDTSHIVNVQDYYKAVLNEDWHDYDAHEKNLGMGVDRDEIVTSQSVDNTLSTSVHTKSIKGRYIVMLQSGASDDMLDRTMAVMRGASLASNRRVRATDMTPVRYAGKGLTATLNRKAVELMAQHPLVDYIEEDTVLRRSAVIAHEEVDAGGSGSVTPVSWNLDRIDQRTNKLNYSYDPDGDGSNVDIFIIDTGVRSTHEEVRGRVRYAGYDAVDVLTGSSDRGADCNGHGTHCAGVAAGNTYGVAKNASIYNLRALNCAGSGAVSGIVQGIDNIVRMHLEDNSGRPMVISQSLGVPKSASLNAAIKAATDAGIVCVGAAGNQGSYSCDYSPASASVGISVGAIDRNDEVTSITNTGKCTTIMAPGEGITSAWHTCDTCTKTSSGTSMAAPHVSGYAAIVLSQNPEMTPAEVMARMIEDSTKGRLGMSLIGSERGAETPNRLLYVQSKTRATEQEERHFWVRESSRLYVFACLAGQSQAPCSTGWDWSMNSLGGGTSQGIRGEPVLLDSPLLAGDEKHPSRAARRGWPESL